MSSQFAQSLNQNLCDTQISIERFIHQEFQRVFSTGNTPIRRNANYIKDLVDLPPVNELIYQQELSNTPRRSSLFKARDSIIDSDFRRFILSPTTLKTKMNAKHLETVEEKNGSEVSLLNNKTNQL